jgi:hypothetical protein
VADEDPGVLGNLPRSRPGRRSDKRGDGAAPRAAAKKSTGSPAKAGDTGAARRAPASSAKVSAGGREAPRRPAPKGRQAPAQAGSDPVAGAVKLAGELAGLPFKVAGEVLKRLPRR